MHYIGAGTDFPFELLKKSCEECGSNQPIRVLISDSDFDHNYESNPENRAIFVTSATVSPNWILLLHQPASERVKLYESLGASVVEIKEMADFPRMASDLTHSLFPDL
jgi:hypothetical protein